MADVHKSNSDDPELPESETVFDAPAGDLRLPADEEDAAGRGPSLDELSGIYAALLQREMHLDHRL